MKRLFGIIISGLLFFLSLLFVMNSKEGKAHIFKLADKSTPAFSELINDLQKAQVIFIGESHNNPGHHQAQLQVIRGLKERGVNLAIGLEMFRSDSQPFLDSWVAGDLPLHQFMDVFYDNWSDWDQYREIFLYALSQEVPLVGLNLSRDIVRQVAREGFASLSQEQLKKLPVVSCRVDPAYERYIHRALGDHVDSDVPFQYFCEAQLLWDKVMAENIFRFFQQNPDQTVVVLAGAGHSWKHGIPAQLLNRSEFAYRVLLPEVAGSSSKDALSTADADYLLIGVDQAPLH